jgi:hypothetical protein
MSFVSFRDLAVAFKHARCKTLYNPLLNGFCKIGKEVIGKRMHIPATIQTPKGIKLTKVEMVYADQNPDGTSREAKMVRTGTWKPHEVGWLWINLGSRRIWLAKTSPDGSQEVGVNSTWVSGGIHVDKDGKQTLVLTIKE